jgi:hypothetical protein
MTNLFFLCTFGVVAAALAGPNFKIRTFRNSDFQSQANPQANVEVHCFNLDENSGKATYVRGTFGMRGYFEGAIVNGKVAQVSWADVGYLGNTDLFVEAGAGTIWYDEHDQSFQNGWYYSAGFESLNSSSSMAPWGIEGNCEGTVWECLGLETTVTMEEIAMQYCFWDVANQWDQSIGNVRFEPWGIYGDKSPSTFWASGLGYNELTGGGPILGAYSYQYTKKECKDLDCMKDGSLETGVYSLDTNVAAMNSTWVITSVWTANSGPYKGQSGSSVYAIVAGPNGMNQKFFGFFCNAKKNNHKNVNAKKIFTGCFAEDVSYMGPNKAKSVQLFQAFGKHLNWFNSWNTWATSVFGYGNNNNNNNNNLKGSHDNNNNGYVMDAPPAIVH